MRVTKDNLVSLPALAPYFAFGVLAFATVPFLIQAAAEPLVAGFYRHTRVLAAVHGIGLGLGTSVAFGALQQMTAVVGATRLHSTRLATAAFVPFFVGAVSLIAAFYTFHPVAFAAAAVTVPLGAALVVYNVARTASTARPTRRWLIIEPFVKSSLAYVLVAFLAGALLALNLSRGFLRHAWNDVFPLHMNMAVGGWFLLLVLGISYHLLTFFGLVEKNVRFRFPKAVAGLIHTGLLVGMLTSIVHVVVGGAGGGDVGSIVTVVAGAGRQVTVCALFAAGALFLWDTRSVYSRPPRQRANHVHVYIRMAHGYLGITLAVLALGVAMPASSHPIRYIALGVLLGGGWLTNTILGYLHRILAFFVWHNKYWGRGREPGVPAFREMVHSHLASTGLVIFNAGVLGFVASLYFNIETLWSIALWALGALVIAVNLARTMLR